MGTALEDVMRHEAGDAVMAHVCGGWVKCISFGRTAWGENFGRAFWAVPDLESYLLVLSGGVLALYFHARPSAGTFDSFVDWVSTEEGYTFGYIGGG